MITMMPPVPPRSHADAVDTIPPIPPEYEAAARAMLYDAEMFRAVLETIGCLALRDHVFARPGLCVMRALDATTRSGP